MPEWILPVATTLLALLVVLKAVPFVLGPLLIKKTTTVLAAPEVKRADALPDTVEAYFTRVEAALAQHGLRRLCTVEVRTAPGGAVSYAAMFVQPERRILGMAAALSQPRQDHLTYMEFSSELADGSILTTNNSAIVSPYKASPTTETLQFDWIADAGALYKVHRARLSSARKGAPRLPEPGGELDFVREAIERPVRAQAEFGYFTLDGATYKLTWKGACRMTWLSLSPLKEKRSARMKARALACLKGLKAEKAGRRAA